MFIIELSIEDGVDMVMLTKAFIKISKFDLKTQWKETYTSILCRAVMVYNGPFNI